MRLSIDIPNELHRDLKAKAATEGKTISEVIRPMLAQFTYGTVPVATSRKPPRADLSKEAQAKGRTRK